MEVGSLVGRVASVGHDTPESYTLARNDRYLKPGRPVIAEGASGQRNILALCKTPASKRSMRANNDIYIYI